MGKINVKKIRKFLVEFGSNYPVLSFYIFSNFINSILLRLFTTGNFNIRPLFFDLGMVIMFAMFSFFVKKNGKKAYYIVTSIIMIAICVINSIYYNYYSSFVSASLLATSVFVKDFGDVIVEFALNIRDWVYVWQLIGMILVIVKYSNREVNIKNNISIASIIVLVLFACGSIFPPYNSWSRLFKLWNRVAVVDSFGVYVYQIDDLIQSLKPTFNNMFGYDNALKEFMQKYSLTQTDDAEEIMRQICKKRGFLLRGGEFDMERCSKGLVDDFRKGKICPVTLELPNENRKRILY